MIVSFTECFTVQTPTLRQHFHHNQRCTCTGIPNNDWSSCSSSSTLLGATKSQRRSTSSVTTNHKKKKKKLKTKSTTSMSTSQQHNTLSEKKKKKSTSSASATSSSSSRSVPPWKVLSAKDAKKNIIREQQRRSKIQQGLIDPHEEQEERQQEQVVLSKTFLSSADQILLKWKRFNPSTQPKEMKLIGSILGTQQQLPKMGVPEIAFLGRSNVGKSSLLNKLITTKTSGSNDVARVGKTPGATHSVNLYTIFNTKEQPLLGFVDLPGFGYAKLSKHVQVSVQQAAEKYLGQRKELALGILLVDIRRIPSDDDRAVLAALYDLGIPIVVVATKMDKLSSVTEREKQLQEIRIGLGLPEGQPFCVSSITGEGTKQLWTILLEACEAHVEELTQKLVERGGQDDSSNNVGEEEEYDMHYDGEEEEDVVYSQGYDWIHDTAPVVFEYSQDEYFEENEDDYVDILDSEEENHYSEQNQQEQQYQKESIKTLKQKARRLERGGQV